MINIRPRETVILANDFPALVAWYRDTLGFRVTSLVEEGFHYANMETAGGVRIGIGQAAEMSVTPPADRANNAVVLQIEVPDVEPFFEHLRAQSVTITGGPSFNSGDNFWFGSFADPEGNPIWVVDENCP